MKIRMLTSMAGTNYSLLPRQEVEKDEETAVAWCKSGKAVPVDFDLADYADPTPAAEPEEEDEDEDADEPDEGDEDSGEIVDEEEAPATTQPEPGRKRKKKRR